MVNQMFLQPPNHQTISMAANTLKGSNQPATVAPASDTSIESKTITAALLQQIIAQFLIVTLLYSAVVWCARNYFACRHNYTVN